MAWVFLAIAIGLEVTGTLALRMATTGRRAWFGVVAVGYLGAFAALTVALSQGLGLGVAYGIWAAAGVALTAVASRVLFEEPLTPLMGIGIGLIAGGVLLVELGAGH
ncbi:cation transporter [Nocardioides sp. Soil777]|uniref:DMT family transporter n=1 Tax=Nocardioides sp. Soil777 TaxID=1736409 RepID=UPI0007035A64|nr:SMR family transporter [Nocardioides sp. Soil777]KRE99111.1 cation transporter [Nocardioides sp. Soil777]